MKARVWCVVGTVWVAIMQAGCISMLFSSSNGKSDSYAYDRPPEPWAEVEPGPADAAFQWSSHAATLSLNSVCDQHRGQTLEELMAGVVASLKDIKVKERSYVRVGGFPALETTLNGRVDDQAVQAVFTVVRSRRCVYDLMYAASPATFPKGLKDYRAVVASFQERD